MSLHMSVRMWARQESNPQLKCCSCHVLTNWATKDHYKTVQYYIGTFYSITSTLLPYIAIYYSITVLYWHILQYSTWLQYMWTVHDCHAHEHTTFLQAMDETCNDINPDLHYQSKVWTHLLIQGFFITIIIIYCFLHCRITVKTSELWNNTYGIM